MSRIQLKERQFEPTGNKLGTFGPSDLESFDLQYTDSDEDENQDSGEGQNSKQPQSHVPDPLDDNPLKDQQNDNKQKSSNGSGGSSSGGQGSSGDNSGQSDGDEGSDDLNVPDEWDPYGDNPDEEDPDLPDSDNSGEGGYGSSDEESGTDDIMPSSGESDVSDTSDTSSNGNGEAGNNANDGEESDGGNAEGNSGGQGDSGNSENAQGNSDPNSSGNSQGSQDGGESSSDSSSQGDGSSDNSNSPDENSSNNSNRSPDGQRSDGSGAGGSTSQAGNQPTQTNPPSLEELEDDDDDFNPEGSNSENGLSDLEKALNTIDNNSTDSTKARNQSQSQESDSSDDSRSRKEIEDEAAAAKDMVGKAVQDVQSERKDDIDSDDDDDSSNKYDEGEDDILKELGAGNLTSLFNPGNLKDWRSRLDKLFDKATGFDIITNPNLINKKIEDAPPGREDELPELKNIAVLLDMSGSMGSTKFKEVIAHIDTMLKARKLSNVWFHIIGWGDSNIRAIEGRYSKIKGSKFKQTMMTKYADAPWGTYIVPGLELAAIKVHKPDAIIIMTDADIFDSMSTFERNTKAKTFIKKYRNKIIWALTSDARLDKILQIDPTLKSKKRYIKFKKDGKRI